MEIPAHTRGVVNISPAELRAYMEAHAEGDYVLIDVRQPEEYQAQHIPGAKLMPMTELEGRIDEVGAANEKHKIFLCRSGTRSARAASFFAESRGVDNVFNVAGGMLGWSGHVLPDFPNVRTFDGKGSLVEVLERAIDLEKGADRLYALLLTHFHGTIQFDVLRLLSEAEVAHGRALFGVLKRHSEGELNDFETFYAGLTGEILEDGEPVERAIEAAKKAAEYGTFALLELALDLEFKAYDLYRNLAHRTEDEELRNVFLALADNEKRHARSLLKAIGEAATT